MCVDLHTHPLAHGSGNDNEELLLKFMHKAKERNINHLGFTDHDCYLNLVDFTVRARFKEKDQLPKIYLGLEVDYFPEKEQEIKEKLKNCPLDYVIGSVHSIGDWDFDVLEQKDRYAEWDIDKLYETYFKLVTKAAASGLFQIMGHLDLIKIFNYRPKANVLRWVEPLLQVIKQQDLTVEINSAGLYKPVGEIYPQESIIARCFELNIPVTISSDAHEPDQVGRDNQEIVKLLKRIGYKQVAVYRRFRRTLLPL